MNGRDEEKMREIARARFGDDAVEIDADAVISWTEGGGGWVAAWVFIPPVDMEETE